MTEEILVPNDEIELKSIREKDELIEAVNPSKKPSLSPGDRESVKLTGLVIRKTARQPLA